MSVIVLGLVVGLGVTACGSGGGTAASVAQPKTEIDAGDQTRAESARLVKTDFPAAFHQDSSNGNEPDTVCADGSGVTVTGSATSPQFIRDDASYAMIAISRTIILRSEDDAVTFYERAIKPEVSDCLGKQIATRVGTSTATWHFDGASEVDGPRAGDQSQTTRLRFTITNNGESAELVDDYVLVRVGNALIAVQLFNVGGPFDETAALFSGPTSDDLVQSVARRMQRG